MTSFADIFKKSFLSDNFADLSVPTILMAILSAFLCGMIIYLLYRGFYKGVIYSNNFNVLLVMVCMVTAFIVLTISSNVVLSLGMVGALSIVRFRTAVKDPLDVGFLFWAVAVGITCGAGLYVLSFTATAIISLIYILLVSVRKTGRVYLLIVKFDDEVNGDVQKILKQFKCVLKNRTTIKSKTELTMELRSKGDNSVIVSMLSRLEGVDSVTMVEYTGDFGE